MSKTQTERGAQERAEDSPVAWFVMLERARESGDFELAVKAKRELKRLGVHVTYSAPKGVRDGR